MHMTMKKIVAPALAVSALFVISSANAVEGLSANIGATSNYLWRGVTQSDDSAAIQGGIDYVHASGLYLGTWASNVDFDDDTSSETDFYMGYSSSAGEFDYDVGYIYYMYPDGDDLDFGEVYGSLTWQMLTVGVNYLTNADFDEDDMTYIYGDLAVPLPDELELAFHIGYSDGDTVDDWYGTDDYFDYGVSLSKSGFTFALSQTDLDDDDDLNFAVSYTMDIDL